MSDYIALQTELLDRVNLHSLSESQAQFDIWRKFYNSERPHQVLGQAVPAERYQPSSRPFPEVLPPIVYEPGDIIRSVDLGGKIGFHNRRFRVGKAFRYCPVALRPTDMDGILDVFFCRYKVAQINLQVVIVKEPICKPCLLRCVKDVSGQYSTERRAYLYSC